MPRSLEEGLDETLPKGGSLRLGRAHFSSTRVWKFGQDRARTGPCLRGEGNGVERLANDPPNPKIPGYGRGAGATVPAAPICHSVHGAGHRIVGGSRPRPRALERASDTVHFAARVRAVWADGYARLAHISVAHLYNLRHSARYGNQAAVYEPTRPTPITIGERRKPDPQGRPGFLRVDTVHQGDWDGAKGVYHINAVDTVTQWQVVGCASKISESYLLPVLEAMLEQFPFVVLGFHADNGSEFINHTVAKLLDKLRAEFTKSRPNRSQDNALVEGKNGSVIRKLIGYGHIPTEHAEALQKFYAQFLNPYLNFHRPCGFATVTEDPRGKRRRRYPVEGYQTPYERLKSLPEATQYLRPGLSWARLDPIADERSDTEWARRMQAAKARLLRQCKSQHRIPPTFC